MANTSPRLPARTSNSTVVLTAEAPTCEVHADLHTGVPRLPGSSVPIPGGPPQLQPFWPEFIHQTYTWYP
eukprot:360329-Chlamydomonas_euryale.AAC.3